MAARAGVGTRHGVGWGGGGGVGGGGRSPSRALIGQTPSAGWLL